MARAFDFKLTQKEKKEIFNIKKLIMIALAALAIRYVILAPFNWIWNGWLVTISAVGAFIVANYLEGRGDF